MDTKKRISFLDRYDAVVKWLGTGEDALNYLLELYIADHNCDLGTAIDVFYAKATSGEFEAQLKKETNND